MSDYFEIGGISIPVKAGLEFSQTYEVIGGTVTQRMQSGRAIKQSHFSKLKTVLSGQGWLPAGLDGLDYSQPLMLKCAMPRSLSSQSSQITIPSSRRNDNGLEPTGFALVTGHLIQTQITINSNIAILDEVAGALLYHVHYYPEIYVFADPPQIQGNMTGAEFSWALTCEEI